MSEAADFVELVTAADDLGVPIGVALIRLGRGRLNPLNSVMQDRLISVCRTADLNRDIRSVVLYGGLDAFSVGADIKELAPRTQADLLIENDRMARTATAVAMIGKPVIAAAEGHVLGGGLELAIAADFRVASTDSSWGLPEVLLGLMPAAGATQRLPRIVGASAAKRLMYTGVSIDGSEAMRLGLVNELAQPGYALDVALRMAAGLVAMPPLALRAIKGAIDRSFDLPLDAGLEYERNVCHAIFATQDRIDGVRNFLNGRSGSVAYRGE